MPAPTGPGRSRSRPAPRPHRGRPRPARRSSRAAGSSPPRPRAAGPCPAGGPRHPSPPRRGGLPPSRPRRTVATPLPPSMPITVSSQRENYQRPDEHSAHAARGGHDIPSAINSPGLTGRGTVFRQDSKSRTHECSPAGGYRSESAGWLTPRTH
ncbi:hypothetical protein FMEAI12_3880004 [Parafrankia sp. Ea1.12]|nr:hypothetical protein FMEAI12_3880004 [Parafrankia sp. Ea1.12]